MGIVDIKNDMIRDLRTQLKEFESLSHTDFQSIKNGLIEGKEKDVALLLDRIDTDRNMTKEIIDDLIILITDFNSDMIQSVELSDSVKKDLEKLKKDILILKTSIEASEKIENKILDKKESTINIHNIHDTKTIDSSSVVNTTNEKSKNIERFLDFLSSKSGYIIIILIVYIIIKTYFPTIEIEEILKNGIKK